MTHRIQARTEAAVLLQRWWRRILVDFMLYFYSICTTLNILCVSASVVEALII